jgi:hypothetical protein
VASRDIDAIIRDFHGGCFPVKALDFNVAFEFMGQMADFVL